MPDRPVWNFLAATEINFHGRNPAGGVLAGHDQLSVLDDGQYFEFELIAPVPGKKNTKAA
jgi:hypothetical protein